MFRIFLAAGCAAACLAVSEPVAAGENIRYISQSMIELRGIPARKRKAVAAPVRQAAASVKVDTGQTMTAEQRRILRYGVQEERREEAAQAARNLGEEVDAAKSMTKTPAEPAAPKRSASTSVTVNMSGAKKVKPRSVALKPQKVTAESRKQAIVQQRKSEL